MRAQAQERLRPHRQRRPRLHRATRRPQVPGVAADRGLRRPRSRYPRGTGGCRNLPMNAAGCENQIPPGKQGSSLSAPRPKTWPDFNGKEGVDGPSQQLSSWNGLLCGLSQCRAVRTMSFRVRPGTQWAPLHRGPRTQPHVTCRHRQRASAGRAGLVRAGPGPLNPPVP